MWALSSSKKLSFSSIPICKKDFCLNEVDLIPSEKEEWGLPNVGVVWEGDESFEELIWLWFWFIFWSTPILIPAGLFWIICLII